MVHISEVRDLLAWLAGLIVLSAAAPVFAQKRRRRSPGEGLTIDPATLMKPWKGDLDAMIERRLIRVLTVPSKTNYFQDKGPSAAPPMTPSVEQELNRRLEKEKKLKKKPEGAGRLHSGRARSAVAGARRRQGRHRRGQPDHYAERQQLVDFSAPIITDVSEVVVTGPASPASPRSMTWPARKYS